LIGDEVLALVNSARSFATVRGCMIRCNSVVRMVVAVVSEPAVLQSLGNVSRRSNGTVILHLNDYL
jgi:hypothetical protein